jgi:hypothetical protein
MTRAGWRKTVVGEKDSCGGEVVVGSLAVDQQRYLSPIANKGRGR